MKWFMHIAESGDDPDIDDAVSLFGEAGYYVFFRTLEVMAREFDIFNPGISEFSEEFFRKKFRTSWRKTSKVLTFFQKRLRIFSEKIEVDGLPGIRINCPKLKELCDEYTKRELAKISGQTPESVGTNSGLDLDIEEDKKSKEEEGRPPDGGLPRGGQDDQPTPLEAGNEIQVMGRTHFSIPLKDGTEFNVSPQDVDQWAEAYPNLGQEGVERALRRMVQWSMSNPGKRKTRKGVRAFINTWLKGDEDKITGKGGPDDDQYSGLG